MVKVSLPKTEYEKLKRQATAYREVAEKFFELIVKDPIEEVVEDFRKTNLYTEDFLRDLESGLRQSSYAKKYGNKTASRRP
ncbi:hypothetical protein CO116_00235 [Candidatus Falkowbacteria bacterium CG_4_9_14_3_um_filter_38_19]|uniref:Uncharacterized protein n=1 Tax=Candidatus Falkowbacteria bacterium CG_4_9_14_3_um_filter_38_19 TaxID=1974559 RepID=A0A2M8AKG7_9BACT|nr:hypothetical protein [Candidatus Parcubacteria bacterium]PJB18102.1 MAG: hypothetical protein CO116_00235 [Candidatus Falkowbacteria bacterium CG_4_9_14_3_um_filter_38_19]